MAEQTTTEQPTAEQSPAEQSPAGPAAFVRAHTRLERLEFLPELRLYQADEAMALWRRTESLARAEQPPPFWAFAWAGGQALARYVLDHAEVVAGRRVLDVAAGSGLVAIAAARAGAASVTANEIDPLAVASIAANARANDVDLSLRTDDILDRGAPDADVVLAGDVFYSRDMAARVLAFLDRARRAGATVLVGDPDRAYLPRDRFSELAAYLVPVNQSLEDTDRKPTAVLRLR